MKRLEQIVLDEVERRKCEIIDLLRTLIKIPSITGEEEKIQSFIADFLDKNGIEVDVFEPRVEELKKSPHYEKEKIPYEGRPNVVGVCRGTGGGRSLLFNGHVDVCDPGSREEWRYDPWGATIEEGRLYGRGASDMKSGLASMTMALKVILDLGLRPKGDVILEYVVDEENTSNGTLACILRGYRADAAINAEASDLEIQPAVSGSLWFDVIVRGRSSSMSRIWEHVSPIEQGYKIFKAIKELYRIRVKEKRHPLYPDPRGALGLFIGVFQSGSFPSNPPELCLLRGRMGILPGEEVEEAKRELIEQIKTYARSDSWLRYHPPEIEFKGYCGAPAEIDVGHPIVETIKWAYRGVRGEEAEVKGHEGASDMRILVAEGVPTIVFGPGTISQMHAVNEWVSVDAVIDATKVMALTILRWCDCG